MHPAGELSCLESACPVTSYVGNIRNNTFQGSPECQNGPIPGVVSYNRGGFKRSTQHPARMENVKCKPKKAKGKRWGRFALICMSLQYNELRDCYSWLWLVGKPLAALIARTCRLNDLALVLRRPVEPAGLVGSYSGVPNQCVNSAGRYRSRNSSYPFRTKWILGAPSGLCWAAADAALNGPAGIGRRTWLTTVAAFGDRSIREALTVHDPVIGAKLVVQPL